MRILLLGFAFLTLANCDPVQNLDYQEYFKSINPVDFYQAPSAPPLGSSFSPIENYGKYRISRKSFLLGILLFIKLLRKLFESLYGAFNLHLLEFTFIYQFYSRKTILVESIFWNPAGLFAFMSFHIYFKLFWYCVLLNMRGFFCPYLFWDTVKWYLNW